MARFLSRFLAVAAALSLLTGPALAQSQVVTQPSSQAATNFSSTIAVTNTFQQVFAASPKRQGCSVQNNGTGTMWVFFGAIADATKAKSFLLGIGQAISCGSIGVVAKDQVSITGTATDAFAATQDGAPLVGPSSTVSATITPSGTQNVNLTQVAGASVATGHGTAAGALRVELPTDGTGVVGLNAGSATVGSIASITTSVTPGGAAANLGKAEDAGHTSGDTGVFALGVVTDGSTSLAATNDYSVLGVDVAGNARVVGSVASGVTDSGNPVKVGGVYRATPSIPVLTDGQRGDLVLGQRSALNVQLMAPNSSATLGITAPPADAVTNSSLIALNTATFPNAFNGSTWDRDFTCPSSAVVNVTAAATTELVALTASQVIRVCSFTITGVTALTTATFVYGTGTNCANGQAALTGAMQLGVSSSISNSAAHGSLFRTISANALCLTAATGNVTGFVTYAKY